MKAVLHLALLFSLGAMLFACAGQQKIPSNQAAALNLCREAYSVYWGSNWNKVAELATKAMEHDPEFEWAYSLRGMAYHHKGQYDLAVEDLNIAIDLDQGYQPAYTNRAITYMKMEEYEAAIKDLRRAMSMNQHDVIAPMAMAEVYSRMNNGGDACEYFEKALYNGFRDLKAIRENPGFSSMLSHDCFGMVLDDFTRAMNAKQARN